MNPQTTDFVTVDMRGMKAALVAKARAERTTVSVLVRAAVARELFVTEGAEVDQQAAAVQHEPTATKVKLSIRMTAAEAHQLAEGARAAGLSRGAYLAGLVAGVPVLSAGVSRGDHLEALTASCAELSTLTRNIHHLTDLLRHGQVRAAQEYRQMLDTLSGDVRSHLALASRVLADLRPCRKGPGRASETNH